MHRRRWLVVIAAPALLASLAVATRSGAATAATAAPEAAAGAFVLTATDRGSSYAPTFTGNGYLSVRVPAAGQGYAGGDVPALSELAGFYADPPREVQQRANLPTWSALKFTDGRQSFSLTTGRVSRWRQQLDLRDGVITTSARWQAPNGHVTDLTYRVFTDRARQYVGSVRLTVTPRWSGTAAVTDLVDGRPATLTVPVAHGWDAKHRELWQSVRTQGTGIVAGLVSRMGVSASVGDPEVTRVVPDDVQSIGQRARFAVHAGRSYTVTKYVGVATSHEAARPVAFARAQSSAAERAGFTALHREDRSAWDALWAGRIEVLGDPTLATEVNASQFYLWSSTRSGVDWSISPAGLSSNGYNGHIFWDAETWMHPALLAQHPDLAAGMDAYRFRLLGAAKAHAASTHNQGARYPWESALDGTEQTPPPVSINSEGLYEQHITADIALAQWQYYLATGDEGWLRSRGWPVLSQAAAFWAGRAVQGADGSFHIRHVTGPDEENPDVNDEAYTNAGAARALRIATAAARALGHTAPASWSRIAARLVVPVDSALGVHPEFRGYQGQLVKQADVTMLQYPWERQMPDAVAQRDLDYYVPRSDPGGPSMSDAINSIDTAALASPGCASYVYVQRSIEPFMRDVFDQFSETRTGGAFTFMTGIGGFLQEFLYGFSGLRWGPHSVTLNPSLTGQLRGLVLHRLAWQGRHLSVSIGPASTTVWLESGQPMTVTVGGADRRLAVGAPITVRTSRPDTTPTRDVARCAPATASSAQRGTVPLSAVDGSPATDWQPRAVPARLVVPLDGTRTVAHALVQWGRMWPGAPAPNVPPPPGPVRTIRPTGYDLLVSQDGTTWTTVASVRTTTGRVRDVLSFPPVAARYLALRITAAPPGPAPMLQELTVTR